jgi:hypothetical protein
VTDPTHVGKIADLRLLKMGPSYPTQKAARAAVDKVKALGGGLRGGWKHLPGFGYAAVIVLNPSEREWADHLKGVHVVMKEV